jgi:hypothetical protein
VRYRGLDPLIRELARAGKLKPEGRGWCAGYAPAASWLDGYADLADKLPLEDRELLRKAAQRLNATLNTWSKKCSASAPVGVDMSRSGRNFCHRVTC